MSLSRIKLYKCAIFYYHHYHHHHCYNLNQVLVTLLIIHIFTNVVHRAHLSRYAIKQELRPGKRSMFTNETNNHDCNNSYEEGWNDTNRQTTQTVNTDTSKSGLQSYKARSILKKTKVDEREMWRVVTRGGSEGDRVNERGGTQTSRGDSRRGHRGCSMSKLVRAGHNEFIKVVPIRRIQLHDELTDKEQVCQVVAPCSLSLSLVVMIRCFGSIIHHIHSHPVTVSSITAKCIILTTTAQRSWQPNQTGSAVEFVFMCVCASDEWQMIQHGNECGHSAAHTYIRISLLPNCRQDNVH